ncbi:MAG: hypothetical protein WCK77_21300 [Verrucomicrobiota bacterium]
MKIQRLLCIAAIGLAAVSCGKVRELAVKAKQAMEAKAAKSKAGAVVVDPALQALVDQTPEGAVFRKDLAFPDPLQVKVEQRLTFDPARIVVKSAIGNQVAAFSGTRFFITRYERAGERIDLTMESAGFSKPEVDKVEAEKAKAAKSKAEQTKADQAKADKAKADKTKADKARAGKSKLEQAKADQDAAAAAAAPAVPDELTSIKELTGCKIGFVREGKGWKAGHSTDFKLAVWGRNLEPHLAAVCVDAGVLPRSYWLGKRRLKPGDCVALAGPELALMLGEGAVGTLNLKLESFEPIGGHPCGVFAVSGNYREAAVPGPDGEVFDADVSISSGKVWLSLVYPVVIREQLETVQTLSTGMRSGHSTLIQGSVSVAVTRTWKPAGPATK